MKRRPLILLGIGVLAGCSGPQANQPQGGGTAPGKQGSSGGAPKESSSSINVYLYQKPKLFSPLEPGNGPDVIVMDQIFDSLLKVNPDYELVPSLATALPTVSSDATTSTYQLKQGLKWSDGEPFTSKDVMFTYNLLANAESGSAAAGTYSAVQGYDDVKNGKAKTLSGFSAPDDHTFVVKTTSPNIGFDALIATAPMLPEHVLGKVALKDMAKNDFFNKPTVCLGPYTFVTYKTDQYVELQANKNYRDPAHIEKIFLKPVTTDVAVAQLGTGEMDVAQISPTDMSTVKGMKSVEMTPQKSATYIQLDINQDRKYFKDPRVRQAMLYAVNRKALVDQALKGQGTVLNSSFLLCDVLVQAKLNDYAYDPKKAKQLLQAAGWDPNQKVVLEWIPGQADRDTSATIVQSQLQAVGMNVHLKKVQAAELLNSIGKSRSYDMLLGGGGGRAPDPWTIYNVSGCDAFYPTNGANVTHFCNKQFDKYMKEANQTPDKTKRMALYAKAAQVSNADPAFLWLYRKKTVWAHNTRIQNFEASDNYDPMWNVQKWTLSG